MLYAVGKGWIAAGKCDWKSRNKKKSCVGSLHLLSAQFLKLQLCGGQAELMQQGHGWAEKLKRRPCSFGVECIWHFCPRILGTTLSVSWEVYNSIIPVRETKLWATNFSFKGWSIYWVGVILLSLCLGQGWRCSEQEVGIEGCRLVSQELSISHCFLLRGRLVTKTLTFQEHLGKILFEFLLDFNVSLFCHQVGCVASKKPNRRSL